MGSMNNWLAFSLSPQDLPPSQPHHHADDVAGDCFTLSPDTVTPPPPPPPPPLAIPALRQDSPFGILEAFNRTHHHQPQEWEMKSLDFKGSSSELSMVVGSRRNPSSMEDDEPKLEDFLGGHSFSDNVVDNPISCNATTAYNTAVNYTFNNNHCSLQLPSIASSGASRALVSGSTGGGGGDCIGGHNSIGLSMIKTWLRNQPAAPPAQPVAGSSQSLSLSMSTGSQSSSPLPMVVAGGGGGGGGGGEGGGECSSTSENKQKSGGGGLDGQTGAVEATPRKSIDTFGQRTSIYRGVTRHRWTGRYEAHLWDNSCRREGQTRKGRQVYLGGYDKEEKAARAYDLAALKYWGTTTTTNFPICNYEKELEEMKHMTRQEYVASLRRKSSGFSRGASIYRGVTRHHQHGRWQARIGRVAGNKDLYLGTFSTQEEAAEAYDIAAIKFRGLNAVTNFDMSRYDVKSIMESTTLPIGGAAKRLKDVSDHCEASVDGRRSDDTSSHLTDGITSYSSSHYHHHWPSFPFPTAQPFGIYNPYQRSWCKPEQDAATIAAAATAAGHGFHDLHQLHLGSSTHNFFQPPPVAALHNMVAVDSSSMEHSTGSNSVIYGGGGGGYMMPVSTMVIDQSHASQVSSSFVDDEVKPIGYDGMFSGRGGGGAATGGLYGYEQSSGSNNAWMPATAEAVASRNGNASACHGGPLFTVWNDA